MDLGLQGFLNVIKISALAVLSPQALAIEGCVSMLWLRSTLVIVCYLIKNPSSSVAIVRRSPSLPCHEVCRVAAHSIKLEKGTMDRESVAAIEVGISGPL